MSDASSASDSKPSLLQRVPPATLTPDIAILGCEAHIVEQFLQLLVTRYDAVDKANYFLERRAGISGANNAYEMLAELGIQIDNYIKRANQLQESWRIK